MCVLMLCAVLLQDMLVKQIEGHTICALGDAGGQGWDVWNMCPCCSTARAGSVIRDSKAAF